MRTEAERLADVETYEKLNAARKAALQARDMDKMMELWQQVEDVKNKWEGNVPSSEEAKKLVKESIDFNNFDLDKVLPKVSEEDGDYEMARKIHQKVMNAGPLDGPSQATQALNAMEEVKDEIMELMDRVQRSLRTIERLPGGSTVVNRAKSYWFAHIMTALEKGAGGYMGGSMFTMADTIEELRDMAESEGEEQEESLQEGDGQPGYDLPYDPREPRDLPPDAEGVDTMQGVDDVFGQDPDAEEEPGEEQREVDLAQEITDYANVLLNDDELRASLPEHAFELLNQIVAKAGDIARMHRGMAGVQFEGAGEPGYDIPAEETAEVDIGNSILSMVDEVGQEISGKLGFDTSVFSKLQRIAGAAKQLINMHKPEAGVDRPF